MNTKEWLNGVSEWMRKLNPDAMILNEGIFDREMNGWINIGIIKDTPYGDAYLMVDPDYPKTVDLSTYRYRATGYNSRPDGSGGEIKLPEYIKGGLQIYDEYRDTFYGEPFLGPKKTEEDKKKHEEFIGRLNISGDKVILTHNSSYRITDGEVKKGKPNRWSNNSDFGIYFWGSKKAGKDISNSGTYTYYCPVNIRQVYDFENNMERYGSMRKALEDYPYIAQYWEGGPEIVVNSSIPVKISRIKENKTGKIYDADWNEIK